MKTNFSSKFCRFNSRALIAFAFSSASVVLAMLAFAANPRSETESASSSPAHSRFVERAATPKTSNEAPTSNGSWSIVPSPNSGSFSNLLNNVTCTSPSDCWAVGSYVSGQNPETRLTLIEHWDGASWTIFSSPNPDTDYAELWGVTCTSALQCWAVGEYAAGNSAQTLIERWDGTSWTIVTSPSPDHLNFLTGVTCTSPSDCWAVGSTESGTLIERWDGMSWEIASSPSPGTFAAFYDVTCTSASQCYAAGYYYSNGSAQTLIEQWNGASWTIAPSPNTSTTQNNFLYGLTCTSASQCWAVGYYQNASVVSQTLVERWDGASWTIVSSPNRESDNLLLDVACISPSQCWAVGLSSLNGQTLVEQWDGASWTIASSSNVNGAQFHQLRGVTCSATSQCWAVGAYQNQGSPYQTLIERADVAAFFFSGEVSLGNGVYYLQFPNGTPFGYYSYLTDPRWIYHFDMGYEYWFDANDGNGGIYFYDSASTHFFYTSPTFPFPYLYDFTLNTVLYYFPDPQSPGHYTSNPRYFYNFATGQIITM